MLEADECMKDIMKKAESEIDISALEQNVNYVYPYLNATLVQGKITASQLEKKEEIEEPDNDTENSERFNKKFIKKNGLTGAERGNAYHRFLELFDYKALNESSHEAGKPELIRFIKQQLTKLETEGYLSADEVKVIDSGKIADFLMSPIGKCMYDAELAGKLHREQQFVMGTLTDINAEMTLTGPAIHTEDMAKDEEYLLVQGIIDAYIDEDDGLILIDYKTDRRNDEAHYTETYRGQQEEYARALEAVYGKPVKKKVLYSLELNKEILL